MFVIGIIGMVLQLSLIYYLTHTNMGKSAKLYYVSCIVSSILSFIFALGIMVTIDVSKD